MWMLSPEEHGHGVGKQPGVVHTAQQSLAVTPVCSDSMTDHSTLNNGNTNVHVVICVVL